MNTSKPHEQRVIDERTELNDKISKLAEFINSSDIFRGLSVLDQSLLVQQKEAMESYRNILNMRISRFGG